MLDIRFEAPGAHWAAAFLQLPLETVQPDVTRRAAQMSSVGIAHTTPVALSDLDRPSAVLTRTQWAIASRVDGTLSPRDLARQSGLSLYETVTSIGALIRRGLCAPTALEAPTVTRTAPPATRHPAPAAVASPNGITRPAAPRQPAADAQPAAAAASVPPVRSAPDGTAPADPSVPAARANWSDTPTPAGRAPWPNSATPDSYSAVSGRGTWTNGASPASRGTTASPAWSRPFTPAATPTPLPPHASGPNPGAPVPAVNPAPVDVPSDAPTGPDSPYRRPIRRPWPQSEAPVPPATLAGHTPNGLPPSGYDPDGHPAAGETPSTPDPADQPPTAVRGDPASPNTSHTPHVPQASRPPRGAHRSDRPARPDATRRPTHEASGPEAPEPPATLPPRRQKPGLPQRRPVLPQRQPGRLLAGAPPLAAGYRSYTATEPGPPTATQPFPALAEDWPQPASFGRTAEPAHLPDHPSAPLPATPPAPARSGGGAESEDFTPAAPDMLRRVLDGLRRLG